MKWHATCRGGAYDEAQVVLRGNPPARVIVWVCSVDCDGHATDDLNDPRIVLKTAEWYRRVDDSVNLDERTLDYEAEADSDSAPVAEESRELELAGVGVGEFRDDDLADPRRAW